MQFRRLFFAAAFILLAIFEARSQKFGFPHQKANDEYDIRSDAGHITCLYRISGKKEEPSVFRKMYLDDELRPIDSVDYKIPGFATLVANDASDKYTIHVFLCKSKAFEYLYFLVTDKTGATHSTFSKLGPEFSPYFNANIKKARNLGIDFVYNEGDPGTMIFTPHYVAGPITVGRTTAWSIEDGREIWKLNSSPLERMVTTESVLVGLSDKNNGSYVLPDYSVHFFNKATGEQIQSAPVFSGRGYRDVTVFTSNGKELMMAGMEFPNAQQKGGHFFSSLYDLRGTRIYDHVDTAALLSSKRMHMLGSAFDNDGNLFLMAEGWRLDYTAAIATTAVSILLGGGGIAGPDYRITELNAIKMSPADGRVLKLYTFKVGPWGQLSTFVGDGSHAMIRNGNLLSLYDPNSPEKAPGKFTSLSYGRQVFISPFGPVSVTAAKKKVWVERIEEGK